jgi:hypothetical protein
MRTSTTAGRRAQDLLDTIEGYLRTAFATVRVERLEQPHSDWHLFAVNKDGRCHYLAVSSCFLREPVPLQIAKTLHERRIANLMAGTGAGDVVLLRSGRVGIHSMRSPFPPT